MVVEYHLTFAAIVLLLSKLLDWNLLNMWMLGATINAVFVVAIVMLVMVQERYLLVLLEIEYFEYLMIGVHCVKEFVRRRRIGVQAVQVMLLANYILNLAVTSYHLDRNNIDWVFVG